LGCIRPSRQHLAEGRKRGEFHGETRADDDDVADLPPRETAKVPPQIGAVDPKQKAVADRQSIDQRVPPPSAFRSKAATVGGDGTGGVEASPAPPLEAPGELGVLAIGEEALGEDLTVGVGDIVERRSAEKGGCTGAAEDPRRIRIPAVIGFTGAAIG
jgi:hypothetical protein